MATYQVVLLLFVAFAAGNHHCRLREPDTPEVGFTDSSYTSLIQEITSSIDPRYEESRFTAVPDYMKNITYVDLPASRHSRTTVLCPSVFRQAWDPNRKPSILYEQSCEGNSKKMRKALRKAGIRQLGKFRCEETSVRIPVYRKVGAEGGQYVYAIVSEEIHTGCSLMMVLTKKAKHTRHSVSRQ